MSFVDLATLALHRRNEMEARINVLVNKCDRAISDIGKLKLQAKSFVHQLNCEPSELKERFLNCMKQLDEYIYLITDFNLSVGKLVLPDTKFIHGTWYFHRSSRCHTELVQCPITNNIKLSRKETVIEYAPVHDSSTPLKPMIQAVNIIDLLSEPTPSTSTACQNFCSIEKPKRKKVPKEEQTLIVFSSTSCSSESVPTKNDKIVKNDKEDQCNISEDINKMKIGETSLLSREQCNLPAQTMLQAEKAYPATIMNIDGASFWVITDDVSEVYNLMSEMTSYYKKNRIEMTLNDVSTLTYCAYFDDEGDCYYRGLFIRLTEEEMAVAEVFLVDTGEVRSAISPCTVIQPLAARFCLKPPYARCCHLAGVEWVSCHDTSMIEKQEEFMKQYMGLQCSVEVDDNSSESLGVYVILADDTTLNEILVKEGLASAIPADTAAKSASAPGSHGPTELAGLSESELDLTSCPEFEDPLEAVTGYSCRDDADICKHYKGGPDKTCFKGTRCKKRHVLKHPDGWTLDRVEVAAKCKSLPLPAPGTWLKVHVTCVCHFDRLYVHFAEKAEKDNQLPIFGVVLPPTTLEALVIDMNSPAARVAYKPLKMTPAPYEMVAALYPPDDKWYRARVITTSRADQNVEVMYVDYGNVVWVKEDAIRQLDARHTVLPAQAVRCALAGVAARSHDSRQWADAKLQLTRMAQERTLDAHVIARDYDEITVELFDAEGYSIAEQMAALNLITLKEYDVIDDTKVKQKITVP